jgi:hypothetical protein
MEKPIDLWSTLKQFLVFSDEDAANLKALAPVVDKHGPAITNEFYALLERYPQTGALIAGRVDALKKTHMQWMQDMVAGDFGDAYFESRWRIGLAHVRIGLAAYWVEAVMSFIRTRMLLAIAEEVRDKAMLAKLQGSFTKLCDLDLMVINLSYGEDRIDRLSEFTGMKRALIENIIKIPKKKP